MAWWLRPCGPGAGSGQAQDAQNSPARPVLADGECYARRTQFHIHASRGVVGLIRPLPYPSTMRAARDPTIDQSWGRALVVRAAAAHCCSLLVLCVMSICAPCMECPRHERRRVRNSLMMNALRGPRHRENTAEAPAAHSRALRAIVQVRYPPLGVPYPLSSIRGGCASPPTL